MAKDWGAVAHAISARMDELEMTQQQLASRAGVSLQTVRELQHNLVPRKRTPRTLQVMSTALEWPSGHLEAVLNGVSPRELTGDSVVDSDLELVKRQLAEITNRLDKIERRLEEPN